MEPECKTSSIAARSLYAIEKVYIHQPNSASAREFITFGFFRFFRSYYVGAPGLARLESRLEGAPTG